MGQFFYTKANKLPRLLQRNVRIGEHLRPLHGSYALPKGLLFLLNRPFASELLEKQGACQARKFSKNRHDGGFCGKIET